MTRHVVLVCGPPCSGKTTYVRQHAQAANLVADFDAYARAAGSPRHHLHAKRYRLIAGHRMAQAEQYIHTTDPVQAWVVRTLPDGQARAAAAEYLRATHVVLLLPPLPVLLDRARHRPPDTVRRIHQWMARHTPSPDGPWTTVTEGGSGDDYPG